MSPEVKAFFDEATNTITYVVNAPGSRKAAVIDPVLDYDAPSGTVTTASADAVLAYVAEQGLEVEWLLETHAHADHLSAAGYLKQNLGAQIGIGDHIAEVQDEWKNIYNLGDEVPGGGAQFDRLFAEGDRFAIGNMEGRVIYTPGHTPACVSYVIGDAVFVGDTLFMPDFGTARCDFPGGSARTLYRSIQKLFELPDETRVFVCHDYPPEGRGPQWETTIGEEKARNPHVKAGTDEDAFVEMRESRDATLGMPKLLLPSLQVNIRAGRLPEPESGEKRYLKIPVNAFTK
jgi:glyoxylase-like metal-dependent hydrolase (beta-lactamase superfamily II)